MKSYVFAVSNSPVIEASASLDTMDKNCEEYFPIVLEHDGELRLLMSLLGVTSLAETLFSSNEDFSAVFDYSAQKLPELSKADFDLFYDEWLRQSGRDTNMDEYGQLIFLQGRADSWNKMAHRFVICEAMRTG